VHFGCDGQPSRLVSKSILKTGGAAPRLIIGWIMMHTGTHIIRVALQDEPSIYRGIEIESQKTLAVLAQLGYVDKVDSRACSKATLYGERDRTRWFDGCEIGARRAAAFEHRNICCTA
jgi:hypothetical protein